MKSIKNTAVLVSPLLLFVILLVPYSWINGQFIVEWFGCGCPIVDELGNIVESKFNANDFTVIFWSFISFCATAISAFLSKRLPKEKPWLKVAYISGMFLASILIAYQFYQMMMWN